MNDERYILQRTVCRPIPFVGVGLHTGRRVSVAIRPGAADTGIVFERTDLRHTPARIPATWDRVVDTRRCTVIGNEYGINVSTVEHLMAALYGCHVDNAIVEIDGPEVPILDGSAAPMVELIRRVGTAVQNAPRKAVRVRAPVSVYQQGRWARLEPAAHSGVAVQIEFGAAAVGRQEFALILGGEAFDRELSPARTFGFLCDVAHLCEQGLAVGGALDNAIIVDDERVLNSEGLRFPDEFARHKALDCVGDMFLAGAPVLGQFYSHKPGHTLNHALLRRLMETDGAWEWVDLLKPGASAPPNFDAVWRPLIRGAGAENSGSQRPTRGSSRESVPTSLRAGASIAPHRSMPPTGQRSDSGGNHTWNRNAWCTWPGTH